MRPFWVGEKLVHWMGQGVLRDMADYVIPAPPQAVVPVQGGGSFPVRRIFCVGRNYAEHAREMGHDPDRELPFFFCKPADALLTGVPTCRIRA